MKSPLEIFWGLNSCRRTFTVSGSQSALSIVKRSSTFVFTLFTFWPPGPDDLLKFYCKFLMLTSMSRLVKLNFCKFIINYKVTLWSQYCRYSSASISFQRSPQVSCSPQPAFSVLKASLRKTYTSCGLLKKALTSKVA